MKVRKEQFLLPKAKNNIPDKTKWVQPNRNGDFTKTLNCTSISPAMMEGLPSALISKVKPDLFLSNGDFIVSGTPLVWQQQNGILRQALLNTEKDVKSEEKSNEPVTIDLCQNQNDGCVITSVGANTNLLTITAVNPQQLTPLATSQVIKMTDYQVILSSETLPVSWLDTGKKNNSSVQVIKPTSDQGQMTFTSVGNVNVVKPNHIPTVVIKDGSNQSSVNHDQSNAPTSSQLLVPNKTSNRPGSKQAKSRKKPVNGRKIMLKPASSLLSQSALDYTNKDHAESGRDKVHETIILPATCSPSELKSVINVNAGTDFSIKSPAQPVALVSSSPIPVSSSSIIISTQEGIHSYNPDNSLALYPKNCFSHNLNTGKDSETNIVYDSSNVTVIGHEILSSTDSCLVTGDQSVALNNTSMMGESVLIDSNTRVICSDGEPLLCSDTTKSNDNNTQNCDHTADPTSTEDYRNHPETILPLDIEHHEEHPTQEYTDNLLSQLSSAGALPNMSSSQVSSVLNALGQSDKGEGNGLAILNSTKSIKESVKCEPTEFVKIEMPNTIRMKPKPSEQKYRVCELNKHTCYRCVNCMFLSLKAECVEKHWADEHQSLRADLFDKQVNKRPIKCLGCTNLLYSKYALQIHLLCDHNVMTTEVHNLMAATMAANRSQREAKRLATKQQNCKTKTPQQEVDLSNCVSVSIPSSLLTSTYETSLMTVITEAEARTAEPDIVLSEPAVEEQKHTSDQVEQIPPTPNFCLFSDIQMPNVSEKESPILSTYEISMEDESKKVLTEKKDVRTRKYKSTRKKLKPDFGSEIKFNYRCHVERCGVRVSSLENLNYHLTCHKDGSEMLFCSMCDFSVVNWSSLTPHLWRQHKLNIDLYSCKYCNYKSNSYSKLMNNHVKIHGEERPFLCDVCGKGFKTTKQLRNHKGIHRARRKYRSSDGNTPGGEGIEAENFGPEYLCNICGRSFADSRILKHHTENVHNKARPYLCTYCSHTASSKSSLRMHVRQHTGEKPFSCNECDYMTSDHNSLRRHKMRHTGLRPYQCPHCSYSCIQSTTYKSHLKNKHPGLDEGFMFSCPMCPFRTVKKDNYLTHKAEHDLGGDPRNRRKKTPLSEEHMISSVKPTTYFSEPTDVVVLLGSAKDLSSVEDEAIGLIVPGDGSM